MVTKSFLPSVNLNSMHDPADRIDFASTPSSLPSGDIRESDVLYAAAFEDACPIERERALWEYCSRSDADLSILHNFFTQESDPRLRISSLWCAQKLQGNGSRDLLESALSQSGTEVASWSELFLRELDGGQGVCPKTDIAWDSSAPFDQTLPLQIAGYACLRLSSRHFVRFVLSPLWFEEILGRVMACTNEATFDTDLVIEKKIAGYNPDGSDHFEIFKFAGFTFRLANGMTEHIYESNSRHTFYPSGKVGDTSVPPLQDVDVFLNRKANPWIVKPSASQFKRTGSSQSSGKKSPREIVESVRGKYMGYAYVNLQRHLDSGKRLGAGEAQLSSLHHPVTGRMTNLFIYGSFKGKLSDLNGDGLLDLNTERAHATVTGELDYNLSGAPNPDPSDTRP